MHRPEACLRQPSTARGKYTTVSETSSVRHASVVYSAAGPIPEPAQDIPAAAYLHLASDPAAPCPPTSQRSRIDLPAPADIPLCCARDPRYRLKSATSAHTSASHPSSPAEQAPGINSAQSDGPTLSAPYSTYGFHHPYRDGC